MNRSLWMFALLFGMSQFAMAGGPLAVGGPAFGKDGEAFVWDASTFPIKYRVDGGPMSGAVDNATGLARVQSMFNNWQVPTASITYSYAGPIQPTGVFAGGNVSNVAHFNAVVGACQRHEQNPIIFDEDGLIVSGLGLDPDIIGFAAPCDLDSASGHIMSGFAVLNGLFQDGINQFPNFELTAAQFDEAITHELGHFSGLDHSQINVDVLYTQQPDNCKTDSLAGLPLMFPYAFCQSRSSAGLPILSADDVAWISKLYPAASFATTYGTISGNILFSDGLTHAQGVNVIARRVDDSGTPQDESIRSAVSVVSGFRFTGNPGQALTGDNAAGDRTGSRTPTLIGYYEIPVPAGTYTVEVESVSYEFTGGSGLGPLDPPVPMPGGVPKFWNSHQNAFNPPKGKETITVAPGQTIRGINIILNGTQPRFDQFEDGGADVLPLPTLELSNEAVRA
jgi:hypothetical protein